MKIEQVPTESVKPYPKNNRLHSEVQIDMIARSISEFGFNQPLVIDEKNEILVGHGRLLAAKQLGLPMLPVYKASGLSPVQKRAYRILDNKLQNDSTWDIEAIHFEIEELRAADYDVDSWGLDALEKAFPQDDPEVTEDDFEETEQAEIYIKRGDVIELGQHRVMCGDSTSAEDVKQVLKENRPHLMVTDPPYGVEYDANWRNNALRSNGSPIGGQAIGKVTNDDSIDWSTAYKLSGAEVAYVWHDGRHAKEVAQSLEDSDFEIRCQIIWAKSNFAIGRGDYHWKHEPCWYAVAKGKTGHYCGDRSQTTLWEINKPQKSETGHSTQKPIECMARPIKNNSKKDEAVYDPFLGSGTTLIAADQLNRICYGMEIEPKYCQVIIDRYRAHCNNAGMQFECKINGEVFN